MLKVGIVGSGFGLYGLLPAFNQVAGCEVISICGTKSERLLKYCASIGLSSIYTDWELMLKNETLDAIVIAVPPAMQYKIAAAAIKKGLHVFAEKPLAANLKQANQLLSLAKKHKTITAVDFIFPEIAEWQKVKQLLDDKVYGKLKYISAGWDFLSYDISHGLKSWKTNTSQGGGAVAYYFSHCLYYLENFAGRIENLKSALTYSPQSLSGGEVGVEVVMKFKNGTVGHTHLNCNAKGMNRHSLIFICEQATIILENNNSYTENFKIEILQEKKNFILTLKKPKISNTKEDARVKHVRSIAGRFVKGCLSGKTASPSFTDGLRVQALIEKIKLQQI